MHPNPAFRQMPADRNLAFARDRGFGLLALNGPDGPLAAHVPFLIAPDGASLDLHLARSNAVARAALPAPALLAVGGPDGYISPDWYGLPDQVPTWHHVAAHPRGRPNPQRGPLPLARPHRRLHCHDTSARLTVRGTQTQEPPGNPREPAWGDIRSSAWKRPT
jgi:predicted FMN-binding regulatory protein PaiB